MPDIQLQGCQKIQEIALRFPVLLEKELKGKTDKEQLFILSEFNEVFQIYHDIYHEAVKLEREILGLNDLYKIKLNEN